MDEPQNYTYKLTLSYRGTSYRGWQFQTTETETVQNYVEKVLAQIARHQEFQVIGASRTDAGVHASGQVLKVTLPREVSPEKLMRGMNSKLPNDIRVVSSEFADKKLNINKETKSKEYHYYFLNSETENALISEIVYPFPEKLNLDLMQEASHKLLGQHNFMSFCSPGPNPTTPYRNILKCSIEKTQFLTLNKDIYYLKIQGTGFMKYMVRYLMGALWDIGSEKLSIEDFVLSLSDGKKHGIRTKAPSLGLHLMHIEY